MLWLILNRSFGYNGAQDFCSHKLCRSRSNKFKMLLKEITAQIEPYRHRSIAHHIRSKEYVSLQWEPLAGTFNIWWSLHCGHDVASANVALENTLLAQEFTDIVL